MNEHIKELYSGLQTAFIDGTCNSNLAYRPQLLTNDSRRGQKVLSSIEDELLHCDEYAISVAFITRSGITPLLQTFQELDKKGIPGRILTTDYLMFSEPEALETLHSLKQVSLKMYCTVNGPGFHTKGYIFRKDELYRIIVGSSNMTQYALTVNQEWNARIISAEQGEFAQNIRDEFDRLWNGKETQDFEEFYELYKTKYQIVKRQRESARRACCRA